MIQSIKYRGKTNKMDEEWLNYCRKKGWTKDSEMKNHDSPYWKYHFSDAQYNQLKDVMLQVAGEAVCLHFEEDLMNLLERGQFFRGHNSISERMEPNRCHSNASILWSKYRNVSIATVYALTKDGMWRQHSWGIIQSFGIVQPGNNQVIETTMKRALYFGYVLNDEESEKFYDDNAS